MKAPPKEKQGDETETDNNKRVVETKNEKPAKKQKYVITYH